MCVMFLWDNILCCILWSYLLHRHRFNITPHLLWNMTELFLSSHVGFKGFPLVSSFMDVALSLHLSCCRTWQNAYFQIMLDAKLPTLFWFYAVVSFGDQWWSFVSFCLCYIENCMCIYVFYNLVAQSCIVWLIGWNDLSSEIWHVSCSHVIEQG